MYISRAGLGLLYYQRRKFMCFAVVKRLPILTLESCIKSLLFSGKENGKGEECVLFYRFYPARHLSTGNLLNYR